MSALLKSDRLAETHDALQAAKRRLVEAQRVKNKSAINRAFRELAAARIEYNRARRFGGGRG